MIHHVSVGTNDVTRSRAFYDVVLPTVGVALIKAAEAGIDYGGDHLFFSVERPVNGKPATVGNGTHIAFAAEDRAMVARFHEAALANGGTSDGTPGLRPEYGAGYYSAFVRDPDGNKLEAVTHSPT